ncbi:MAG TPA: DUF1080 domain-containing protein [Gammaproteobacteria bacterium]
MRRAWAQQGESLWRRAPRERAGRAGAGGGPALLGALALGLAALAALGQTPEGTTMPSETERAQGWRALFDGETLAGWRALDAETPPAGWRAAEGELVRESSGGDLLTVEQFDDFELRLEWRIAPGGNSGVLFRVLPEHGEAWETGPEFQVLDNASHPDGRNPLTSAGANYALHAPLRDATRPPGQWNDVRLVVDGAHVEHWLNGEKVVEYELWSEDWEARVAASKFASLPHYGRARRGHIALQDHGDLVAYRNIMIRPLTRTP